MRVLKKFFKRLAAIRPREASPHIFLEEMLQNSHNFKSVMVVIQYQDDTMDCDWSQMQTRDLAMACIVLDEQLRRCILDRGTQ